MDAPCCFVKYHIFTLLQQQENMTSKNRKAFASMDFDTELGGQFIFSDHDSA